MEVDAARWSGEGAFTAALVEQLKTVPSVDFVRVEDAPASHSDGNYNFISNEIYVRFRRERSTRETRLFGVLPVRRSVWTPVMTLEGLHEQLVTMEAVGPADYADDAMLQYLRTERIVPPYQTRGYKVVELVRVYRLPP